MKQVNKSVLLWYSPHEMYELVTAVADYPKFLPWCERADVLEKTSDGMTAKLHLAYDASPASAATPATALHEPVSAPAEPLVDEPIAAFAPAPIEEAIELAPEPLPPPRRGGVRGPSRASARSSLSNSSIRIPRSSLQNGIDSSHTILLPGVCDTSAGSSCASQNVCFSPQLKRTVYESSWVRLRGCGFTSSITPSNPTKGEATVGRTRTRSPGLNRAISNKYHKI